MLILQLIIVPGRHIIEAPVGTYAIPIESNTPVDLYWQRLNVNAEAYVYLFIYDQLYLTVQS